MLKHNLTSAVATASGAQDLKMLWLVNTASRSVAVLSSGFLPRIKAWAWFTLLAEPALSDSIRPVCSHGHTHAVSAHTCWQSGLQSEQERKDLLLSLAPRDQCFVNPLQCSETMSTGKTNSANGRKKKNNSHVLHGFGKFSFMSGYTAVFWAACTAATDCKRAEGTHQGRVGGITTALSPHQLQGLQLSLTLKGHQESSP